MASASTSAAAPAADREAGGAAAAVQACRPFKIERFFAKYEFTLRHHLSQSDCETVKQRELLAFADEQCTKLWDELDLGYTESLGHELLRDELRQRYRSVVMHNRASFGVQGTGRDQEEVGVMTCVPVEGITMTMNALLAAGDQVIAMEPCYQVLQEIARSRNCEVVPWAARFNEATSLFEYDLTDLTELFSAAGARRPKMLILNTPHNPTGYHFYGKQAPAGGSAVGEILRLCAESGTIVFSDEMYGRILQDFQSASGERLFHTFAGLSNTIVLSGLSKPQGLPGLRTGWLVVDNPEHFSQIMVAKDYMTICASAPSEILALIALRNEQKLLQRNWELVEANARSWCDFCARLPGWFRPPQLGGELRYNTLLAALGATAIERFATAERFSQALIDQFGICLVPDSCFYEEPSTVPGVRVGLGKRGFGEVLEVLEAALQQLEAAA